MLNSFIKEKLPNEYWRLSLDVAQNNLHDAMKVYNEQSYLEIALAFAIGIYNNSYEIK